jgi:hypothetical protein
VSARRRNPDIVYQDRDDTYVVVWEEADWGEYVAFDSATINRMKMNGSDLKPLVNHPFSIPITSKKHITRHPAVAAGKNNLLTVWGGEVWNPSGTKYYWDPAVNQWKVKDEWFGELRWPGPDIYGLLTAY